MKPMKVYVDEVNMAAMGGFNLTETVFLVLTPLRVFQCNFACLASLIPW